MGTKSRSRVLSFCIFNFEFCILKAYDALTPGGRRNFVTLAIADRILPDISPKILPLPAGGLLP
jgi:hypothetical protein